MAAWNQFYDDVMPEAPGCSTAMAEKEIKNAGIDFMIRTQIQRKTVSNLDHPGGASAISLSHTDIVTATDQVVAVLGVWFSDKPLDIKSVEQIQELYPNWDTITGTPEYAVQEGGSLWLVPSPAAAQTNTIRVRVSFAPNETAAGIPDIVFHMHREDIALGAKARLLAKKNKPWTDQSLAAEYLRGYSRAVDAAAVKSARGGAKVLLTVPTRSF